MTKFIPAIAFAILPLAVATAQTPDAGSAEEQCNVSHEHAEHGSMAGHGTMHHGDEHMQHGAMMHGGGTTEHNGAAHGGMMHGDAEHDGMMSGGMMHDEHCASREDEPQDN